MNQNPTLHYQTHIFCCTNQRPDGHAMGCCASKGSQDLQNYMKARAKEWGITDIRVNKSGCLDRCEFGPTLVIYPDGTWYRYQTREDVDRILQNHVINNQKCPDLVIPPGLTDLAEWAEKQE